VLKQVFDSQARLDKRAIIKGMTSIKLKTEICIAGAGPAGMMLAYFLARSGIQVVLIEKHADFFRDFRGDTIHPSTMEILAELSLLEDFLKLPHQEIRSLLGSIFGYEVTIAEFSRLKVRSPFIALVPQWDFLNFLAKQCTLMSNFKLAMQTEAVGIIEENGVVVGLRAKGADGKKEIRAELVIGADGRSSTIRRAAGLEVKELAAPIDVLWFRISRKKDDPYVPLCRIVAGRIMVMIYRGDYWQCGFVIKKDGSKEIHAKGIACFREELLRLAPFLTERVNELKSLDDLKLLSVKVDRLVRWFKPGLLCIGDAAHAMSPVGGVGINLAIQDAVAAANIIVPAFFRKELSQKSLELIQKRRFWPTVLTQYIQVVIQNRVLYSVLESNKKQRIPMLIKLFNYLPFLRKIPAHLVGVGIRPEHVKLFTY
jgi:2-polyprenyl-6-methoxyphenol hydroxylase-like FAD-dependent oxidoreductase